jgi:hypothetical protein
MKMNCEICKKQHDVIDDVYEWYGHYLDYNKKNTEYEIWDIENKIWVKVIDCENDTSLLRR